VAWSPARWLACLASVGSLAVVASAQAGGVPFLGVYGDDAPGTAEHAVAVAGAQHAAGARVVRLPFIWSKIEPLPGVLDLRQQDTEVAAAARAGIDVLPFIIDAPTFRALPVPAGYVRLPSVPADLGAFAAALVWRYGPGGSFWAVHPELPARPIRAWQVWNEPNLVHNWYPRPDPAAYAQLLRAAAAALHAADPSAEVIAAGMPDSDNGVPFEEYVAGLYAAGAQRSFDAFALHAYAPTAQGTVDLVRYVRGLLDAHGDGARPLDVTEFGWASAGPVKPQTTTEERQAQNISAVVRALGAERTQLGLERLVYFSWRDRALAPGMKDQWPYYTGLLRTDASAKPALAAFRDAALALDAPPISGSGGPVAPGGAGARLHVRRSRIDHHPVVRVLGSKRRSLAAVLRPGWRVRVRCRARCVVRLRLVITGQATASHARIALARAGTRTIRLAVRASLRGRFGKRRTALALEAADVSRTPLRIVARIRLAAVA
jgi:hypothetical protein